MSRQGYGDHARADTDHAETSGQHMPTEARRGLPQQKGKRKEDAAKVPLHALAVSADCWAAAAFHVVSGSCPACWLSAERCVLVTQTVVGSKKGRSAFEDITNKKEESKGYPTAQKVRERGGPSLTCFASPHMVVFMWRRDAPAKRYFCSH